MREFTSPEITTKGNVGKVDLSYAFRLTAIYDQRHVSQTSRGGRVYRAITGGTIEGPGLNGKVYADSGGDYGLIREDKVEDLSARFMTRAENGEWIYFSHVGYRRPDGYHRIQAYFDADAGGPYAWLNDAAMIATAVESPDGKRVVYTYYQAI